MNTAIDITKALRVAGIEQRKANGLCTDMRSAPLKESAFLTFKAILKLFKRHALAGTIHNDPETGMSMIRTCNGEIANVRRCHARTVQRHRAALAEAGLVQREIFHGSHCAFEVWVADRHLGIAEAIDAHEAREAVRMLIGESEAIDAAIEAGQIQITDEPQPLSFIAGGDKMPTYNSCTVHSNEHNADVEEGRDGLTGDSVRPAVGKFEGTQETGKQRTTTQEKALGGRVDADPLDGLDTAHATHIRALAAILWMNGKRWLWPSLPINAQREAQTLNMIHRLYARIPEKELDLWHKRFIEMERLAAEYLERSPIPAPNAAAGTGAEQLRFIVPPWKWFDTTVAHGIAGTWTWWRAREQARENGRAEHELYKAVAVWEANERKAPSKQRDRIKLYGVLREKLAAWGRPMLLDQFEIFIQNTLKNGKEERNAG